MVLVVRVCSSHFVQPDFKIILQLTPRKPLFLSPMKISSPILMAYPGPPRRAAGLLRYVVLAVAIVSLLFYFRHSAQSGTFSSAFKPQSAQSDLPTEPTPQNPVKPIIEPEIVQPISKPEAVPEIEKPIIPNPPSHPIDTLIEAAEKQFDDLLKKESHDVNTAAAEYRKRRGRHPPPGFDTWFKFAQENNAVMVEDFFDQIYHDLGPFWGLPPAIMRKEAWAYEMTINVRNKNATAGSDWFWTQIWLNLTQTIEHLLPDMDLALNAMDEPRIVLPWEQINEYMEIERKTRSMPPANEVISEFQTLPKPEEGDPDVKIRPKNWEDQSQSSKLTLDNLMLT